MTAALFETLQDVERHLIAAGIESARADARILIAHVLGIDRNALIGQGYGGTERTLAPDQLVRIKEMSARRAAHEPVALITGHREFWSLDFRVSAATLIPRPDSETLIEAVLDRCADRTRAYRVLDLGTGSGCLLLALLSEWPNATGLGIDASQEALDMAALNADRLGLADRSLFAWGDWAAALDPGRDGRFDVIVSNPPYVTKPDWDHLDDDVRLYEPRTALVGGLDGLNPYRAFVSQIRALLAPDGLFVCEFGMGQAADVAAIVEEAGLTILEIRRDLAGLERCLLATVPEN